MLPPLVGAAAAVTNLLRGCPKVKRPLDAKALDRVERPLSKRDVAAFIMEPIICNAIFRSESVPGLGP